MDYEEIEKAIRTCPMTYVPALLQTIIDRCRNEPIFKGWMGLQSFISRAYKRAGKSDTPPLRDRSKDKACSGCGRDDRSYEGLCYWCDQATKRFEKKEN